MVCLQEPKALVHILEEEIDSSVLAIRVLNFHMSEVAILLRLLVLCMVYPAGGAATLAYMPS